MRLKKVKLPPSWQLFVVLTFVLLGILSGLFVPNFWLQTLIVFVVVGVFSRIFILKNLGRQLTMWFFAILFFWAGVLVFLWKQPSSLSVQNLPDNWVLLEANVDRVQDRGTDQYIYVDEVLYGDELREDKVLLKTRFADLRPGDKVRFSCKLESPEAFDGFRYDWYLASRGVYKTCQAEEVHVISHTAEFKTLFWKLRQNLSSSLKARFSEPQATLFEGLLVGDVVFADHWQERFAEVGVSHIVAASGYNVTLLSVIVFGLLTWLGFRRQQAIPVIFAAILLYVGVAGFSTPVVRAAIMASIILLGRLAGRRGALHNVLMLTVVLMTAISPYALVADAGFQLSILSTFGLIYLMPWFEEKLSFLPSDLAIRESFASTMSALLVAFPVLALQFGSFSLISPLANLLILPLVPLVSLLGLLSLLLPVGSVFVLPAWLAIQAILFVATAFSELPLASVAMHVILSVILSVTAFILTLWILRDSKKRRLL